MKTVAPLIRSRHTALYKHDLIEVGKEVIHARCVGTRIQDSEQLLKDRNCT